MSLTVANPSRGPKLTQDEKGVHIIRLVADDYGSSIGTGPGPSGSHGTPAGPPSPPPSLAAKPTDIIVFDRRPWHMVNGQLKAHPQVHHDHPNTILELSIGKGERAVWWSEERFDITSIHLTHHGAPASSGSQAPTVPDYPFSEPVLTVEARDGDGRRIYIARSTVPVPGAKHHVYKISFSTGGDDIDPDMACAP